MFRKPSFAVAVSSLYLLVYYLVFYLMPDKQYVVWMFMGAPFLLGWLAYTILKFGKFDGPELNEDEEWGYSDRNKNTL